MRLNALFTFFLLLITQDSYAVDLCTQYSNTIPLPSWYTGYCLANKSSVGGGFATFADAFSLNPAAIPTVTLPLGFEAGYSAAHSGNTLPSKYSFSFLKGYNGFGFGFAGNNDDSIFTNHALRSTSKFQNTLDSSYAPSATTPSLNLALAALIEKSFPQIGLLARYDKNYKTISPGFGASYNFSFFSFGFSFIKESENEDFGDSTVITLNAGAKILGINLEAARINTSVDRKINGNLSFDSSSSTTIVTASTNIAKIILSSAIRYTSTSNLLSETIYHGGARFQFTQRSNLAYFYNYVPGYHTLALQFFL